MLLLEEALGYYKHVDFTTKTNFPTKMDSAFLWRNKSVSMFCVTMIVPITAMVATYSNRNGNLNMVHGQYLIVFCT